MLNKINQTTLIKNALLFDGTGNSPKVEDLLIRDGLVAMRGLGLSTDLATEVVDAKGLWLMPGLLDIHTHMDLEVEVNPGLAEVVRHGTTTVVVGNCSLGTAFGAQVHGDDNPIVDCFTRVENMPKPVLQKCVDKMYWHNTADYLKHFADIPLGPNIAPFIPHSMLRIEVMGVEASVSRSPTAKEHQAICDLLQKALEEGYIGLSSDQIIFHYLSNDPHKDKRIPTQFASDKEMKDLIELLRNYDRVWQTNPDSDELLRTVKRYFWTSGRLHRKPLKITALTAIDFIPAPGMWKKMLNLGSILNSFLFKGNINFQALATNFRIWSNGVIAPFFEELVSTRRIIAFEAEDKAGRLALLRDPKWQASFRADWERITDKRPRGGFTKLVTFRLDMDKMFFDDCACAEWNGDSIATVISRLKTWQQSKGFEGAKNATEAKVFAGFPDNIDSDFDFFLNGLIMFDIGFRWWFDSANVNEAILEEILFHSAVLPGFNDSGAHITNMSFYDANLMLLKMAQKRSLDRVAHAVQRLTREPADFLGLDVGRIEIGDRADLVLINPEALRTHDSNNSRSLQYHPYYECDTMVSRSDGVVEQVYIHGVRVWEDAQHICPVLGEKTLGRVLTAV